MSRIYSSYQQNSGRMKEATSFLEVVHKILGYLYLHMQVKICQMVASKHQIFLSHSHKREIIRQLKNKG